MRHVGSMVHKLTHLQIRSVCNHHHKGAPYLWLDVWAGLVHEGHHVVHVPAHQILPIQGLRIKAICNLTAVASSSSQDSTKWLRLNWQPED